MGLVNIAIDGIDKVGKTAVSLKIENQYGIPRISADIFRLGTIEKIPLEIRVWADIPVLGTLIRFNKVCVLDRSIISALAYNDSNKDIYDKLFLFIDWYKEHSMFVFNTFRDINTVLERNPGIDKNSLVEQDEVFRKVYQEAGIWPLFIYAEDSIESKVRKIMEAHFVYSNRC